MNVCSCCMFLDYEGVSPLLDGPQTSTTCPALQSNFKKKLSVEYEWTHQDVLVTSYNIK